MKVLKLSLVTVLLILFASCSKQEQKVDTENQNLHQNVVPDSNARTQSVIISRWIGQYAFDESAPNASGSGTQSWSYVMNISVKNNDSLKAIIWVDGFQTMTRIEAEVKATEKNADIIFSKYGAGNIFETYKSGEKLFSLEINENNEMITNWDNMKPNIPDNQNSGKVRFKKVIS